MKDFSDSLLHRLLGQGFRYDSWIKPIELEAIKDRVRAVAMEEGLESEEANSQIEIALKAAWKERVLKFLNEFILMTPVKSASFKYKFPTAFIGEYPEEVDENNLNWTLAIASFDYGDSTFLADMVENGTIPDPIRPVIAKILSGERIPKHVRKIKGRQRAIVAYTLWVYSRVAEQERLQCEEIGDSLGISPTEAYRIINKFPDAVVSLVSEFYDMSEESVKDLRSEMEKVIKIWD